MWITFWVVAASVAVLFLFAGTTKLVRDKAVLAESGLEFVEDFSAAQVKLIGGSEVLGAVGIVLPMLLGILPVLSPVAAIALALLMVGAVSTHARRKEPFVVPLVLGLLSAVAAGLGFWVLA